MINLKRQTTSLLFHKAHPPHPSPLLKGEGIPCSSREKDQQGFSQLLLVGLIAAGIIAGTLLVQNGVSFIPKAAEQEELHPSAGKTQKCSEISEVEARGDCQKSNDSICASDTVTYCDNRNGSPRAIRKSGGYYEPGNTNADPNSGCVFDYREVSNKDTECGKTESKNGDVVYTTKEEAQTLDKERRDTEGARSSQQSTGAPGSAPSTSASSTAACTDTTTEQSFIDEKISGNLVRFYAILSGVPGYCVPADLGVEAKPEEADAVGGGRGRLLLCSDPKEKDKLVWNVILGTELKPAADKGTPTIATTKAEYETGKKAGTLKLARQKAGLEQ